MVLFDEMIQCLRILSCRLFLFCRTFWSTSYVQGDMNEALDGQGFSFLCGELACVAGAWNVVGTRKNGERPFSL